MSVGSQLYGLISLLFIKKFISCSKAQTDWDHTVDNELRQIKSDARDPY